MRHKELKTEHLDTGYDTPKPMSIQPLGQLNSGSYCLKQPCNDRLRPGLLSRSRGASMASLFIALLIFAQKAEPGKLPSDRSKDNVVKEPFAPFCSPTWIGQILGIQSREQCRLSFSTSRPFTLGKTLDQEIVKSLAEELSVVRRAGKLNRIAVDIMADDGTIWILGRVASKEQQVLILEIARRINGVKQVVNDLDVVEPSINDPPAPPMKAAP
jgi:hypothetical protein